MVQQEGEVGGESTSYSGIGRGRGSTIGVGAGAISPTTKVISSTVVAVAGIAQIGLEQIVVGNGRGIRLRSPVCHQVVLSIPPITCKGLPLQQGIDMIEFPRGQIPRPDVAQERHDALDDANQQRQTPSFEGTLLSSGPPLSSIAKVLLGRVGAPYLGFIGLVIMGLDVLERVLGVGGQLPAAAASIAMAMAIAIAEDGHGPPVPVVVVNNRTTVLVMVALVVVGIAAQAKVVGVSRVRVGLADAVVMMMAIAVSTMTTAAAVAIAAEI